jgi:predicted amidohydrolase YtcJ
MLSPHLIIHNAAVITMDPERPRAQAVAVVGNRVAAAGSDAEIKGLAGPGTRVVDARGGALLPGLNDAHVHFLQGGFSLTNVNLRPASSPKELASKLAEYVRTKTPGTWIQGGEWDHENWPGAPLPTRLMIDDVTPRHPVLVSRLDGHMALANSLALKLAGITRETQDPPGGLIVRDPGTGDPTGLLKDAAVSLVEKAIPAPSYDEKHAAAEAATEFAASLGITSVCDVSADEDVGLYQAMAEGGELKTRIYAVRSIVNWEPLVGTGVRRKFGSDLLRIGGLKGFSDGSLGSSTALFFEPYCDAPGTRGLLFDQMLPEGTMLERVARADAAGLQVMIHAIGDEANFRVLEIFREAAEKNGDRDRRFRIEHAQHLRPTDIPRFGRQKLIASMQPYHAADDGRWCEKRVGRERSRFTYCFKSLLDSGAVLAFGSDWTVAPLNPLTGIKAAVTRQTLDGKHPDGWTPEEKISLDEAIRGYTVGSAYAEFTEHEKGAIAPGKLADLVLFDRDIYRIKPEEIDQARTLMTVMDGRVVFEKPRPR